MSTKVSERLELGPGCAAEARRMIARLDHDVPRQVVEDARLMVSELVTNCHRHAGLERGASAEVSAEVTREALHVEVADRGVGFAMKPNAVPTRERQSGWGLAIVDALADRWGSLLRRGATVVWFEIDLGKKADARALSALS